MLVIFAISLVALILFVGLALDAGSLYVTYGQLKRAVDAASVAAANDFKRGRTVEDMYNASLEVLNLHNINLPHENLHVYICDNDGVIGRDDYLQTAAPVFWARCPTADEQPRKLVWVDAELQAPLYFLGILGFRPVTLRTNAIAEAAPVDIVLVFDISESMTNDTQTVLCTPYWDSGAPCPYINDYRPNNDPSSGGDPTLPVGCNITNSCQPLLQAKIAARALVDTLYEGYDQVAIVTFDTTAIVHPIQNRNGDFVALSDKFHGSNGVNQTIDAIQVHDDPPFARLWQNWRRTPVNSRVVVNPVNPEDRDGDGRDADPALPCVLDEDRWDTTQNPYGWGGVPCDADNLLDAYDWDNDGVFTMNDDTMARNFLAANDPDGTGPQRDSLSFLSTCTGCGIRVAGNILKQNGRPSAVWVIIFLSDGGANLTDTPGIYGGIGDTPDTGGGINAAYPSGYCSGALNSNWWVGGSCVNTTRFLTEPRYCIDSNQNTCPPGTSWTGAVPNPNYNVLNYAMDKVDEVALTISSNINEPLGNDIAIYTIGLGSVLGNNEVAENMLRYFAAVGDDGNRETNPCQSAARRTSCGQYYFAPSGDALLPIFEDIASRIYTRITD